ncbi:MAG: MlaA family lipoprotein [Acidiferrobacteraceae bacterium]
MARRQLAWGGKHKIFVPIALLLLLGACSTLPRDHGAAPGTPPQHRSIDFISHNADPFHRFNKEVFTFNRHLDRFVLKPTAHVYVRATPLPLRVGVTNVFHNLGETTAMVNDILQVRFKRFAIDLGRFVVNSTIGVLGLVDVATPLGLRAKHQDFGMTLAKWGVHSGPYLVLPFFGPSDVRDAFGLGADWYTSPTNYLQNSDTQWGLLGLEVVNTRAQYLNSTNILRQAAGGDEYDFVREAYRQQRQYQLSDGNPSPPPPPPPSP